MNRKIIFRGKGIADNEWYYGDLVQSHLGTAWIITEDYTTATEDIILNTCASPQVNIDTVGQCTGLCANGKEIYDGDIVYVHAEDENAKVEWDEQMARFIILFDGWIADFDNYKGNDLEVVGNIYDNSDLLGGERIKL